MQEQKVQRYILYAIGEILLVVIGILIALQVNNWNEQRIEQKRAEQYVRSLVSDLVQDSLVLVEEIEIIEVELSKLQNFNRRLSSASATYDTVRHIAQFEYLPFFNPSNELNRNTITSLLSTGDINLFPESEKNMMLSHNSLMLNQQKIMDANVDIFLAALAEKGTLLGPTGYAPLREYVISGPLSDEVWSSYEPVELLKQLSTAITSKMLMFRFRGSAKQNVLDSTTDLITYFRSTYPLLHLE